jgi:hypothetical protein
MKKERKIIPIDKMLYENLKSYCKEHGYVIKSLVEKLIKKELTDNGSGISTSQKG